MVLENKLGITDSSELAREEERLSKKKAVELFESGCLDSLEAGTYAALAEIHRRSTSQRAIRFVPSMYLEAALRTIDRMPQSTFDEIVEKYVEMNVAHPFREGNGRSMRIWLDLILRKELGVVVDWSGVDKEDYLPAMERSPVRDVEIKHLLKRALTDNIDDRALWMRSIDHSYRYEGYSAFRAEDLHIEGKKIDKKIEQSPFHSQSR